MDRLNRRIVESIDIQQLLQGNKEKSRNTKMLSGNEEFLENNEAL